MARVKKKSAESRLRKSLGAARCILQDLAGFLSWAISGKVYMDIEEYEAWKKRKLAWEERERLRYLKRQRLIEMKKISGRVMFRLTEKGWARALRDQIKTTRARCKDGMCCVIFDIPERERFARDALRKFLKECGFIRLQHSVWITNREVVKPLRQLLQRRKLERWIRIVVGKIVAASPLDKLVIRQNYRN